MSVRLLRAFIVALGDEAQRRLTARYGDDADVWGVELEIAAPAPGANAFIVGTQTVMNRAGEVFVGTVIKDNR
jgi:hypothetical protein